MAKFRSRLIGAGAAGAMAVGLIGAAEGLKLKSYPDVIGVWTVCYGETKNVKPGMVFTKAECDQMFMRRLIEFETKMAACLTDPQAVPIKTYIASLSLAYNIGSGGFCKSTVAKRINAGDYEAACNYLVNYNRAGGKVWRGLTIRRERERKYCLEGLK